MTIPRLLQGALARDGARPFVTFYDEHSGERTELSVATTANWVAKTANMLQDSLDAESGSVVRIDLPLHWETLVWLLACWSVGCSVATDVSSDADIAVLGPELRGADHASAGPDIVVALSLRPLGARFADPLPAGVVDYNAEVLGHGDHFGAWSEPTGDTVALSSLEVQVSQRSLIDGTDQIIKEADIAPGARILVTASDSQLDALVAALVVGGSVVLVTDSDGTPVKPERLRTLADAEHVTAQLS